MVHKSTTLLSEINHIQFQVSFLKQNEEYVISILQLEKSKYDAFYNQLLDLQT